MSTINSKIHRLFRHWQLAIYDVPNLVAISVKCDCWDDCERQSYVQTRTNSMYVTTIVTECSLLDRVSREPNRTTSNADSTFDSLLSVPNNIFLTRLHHL